MIILYTGKPRSGKSYRMVYEMLQSKVQDKYFIVHDIDGLKHERFNDPGLLRTVDEVCKSQNVSKGDFFTLEFQKDFSDRIQSEYSRPMLLVRDECHRSDMADLGRKNMPARDYLAYHGHYGQEVWLATQGKKMLHPDFRALVGYHIHAKKGAVIPFFIYSHKDGDASVPGSRLPKKKEIFDAYKSFNIAEGRQRTSYIIPGIAVCMIPILAFCVWYFRNPFSASRGVAKVEASVGPGPSMSSESVNKAKVKVLRLDEKLQGYRFAGLLGSVVLLQRVNGGGIIHLIEIDPEIRVLTVSHRSCVVRLGGEVAEIGSRAVRIAAREGGEVGSMTTSLPSEPETNTSSKVGKQVEIKANALDQGVTRSGPFCVKVGICKKCLPW